MAKKDDTIIADLSLEDLKDKITEASTRYGQTKFSHAVTPLESPIILKGMRREVARLRTELRAREINNSAE